MATGDAPPARSRIFISYRRTDSDQAAARLADDLRRHFVPEQVFLDFASIDPGLDFVEAVQKGLDSAAAVLVVIGRDWLDTVDKKGRRRIDLADDWVRYEVAESLKRPGVRVFPVLVDGADMPGSDELPESLRPLTRRQALPLTVRHWTNDVADLIQHLRRVPGLDRPTAAALPRKGEEDPASRAAVQDPIPDKASGGLKPPRDPSSPRPSGTVAESVAAAGGTVGAKQEKRAEPVQQAREPQPSIPPRVAETVEVIRADTSRPGDTAGVPKRSGVSGEPGGTRKVEWKLVAFIVVALAIGVALIVGGGNPQTAPPSAPAPVPAPAPAKEGKTSPEASAKPEVAPATTPSAGGRSEACAECPEMVVVPAGTFQMGSPKNEAGRSTDEGPQHQVEIKSFELGRTAVTVGEFRRFVKDSGYTTEAERNPDEGLRVWDDKGKEWAWSKGKSWRDPGFAQDDRHPVVGVSWNDAREYVKWLNGKTGRSYRLPSEAEREYATRAKTDKARFWGEDPDQACRYANVADKRAEAKHPNWAVHECDDGHAETSPVASFKANAFGLYDMIGNVWEWTQDCWNESYKGAPAAGQPAWEKGDCGRRVVRGGGWNNDPQIARSAVRLWLEPGFRDDILGFRLARTL